MRSISHCTVLKYYCHWAIRSASDLELLLKYLGLPVYIVIILSLELAVLEVSRKVAVEMPPDARVFCLVGKKETTVLMK